MDKKEEFKYVFKVDKIEKSNYVKKEKKKIKEKIFNKTTFLTILLIIFIYLNIFQHFSHHEFDKFIKILFINKDNEFQWGGSNCASCDCIVDCYSNYNNQKESCRISIKIED